MMQSRLLIAVAVTLVIDLVSPVFAHTTIGSLNGTPTYYRSDDHELNPTNTFGKAHVPGPLGYVWPGAGFNLYTGRSGFPGYQSPFQDYEEPLQVAGNSYSPEGAILASTPKHDSVGDLIFAVNLSQPKTYITPENPAPSFNYSTITLYLPAPLVDKHGRLVQDGFEPVGGIDWERGDSSNIVTTITADYGRIFVGRADANDPFAPGWWSIRITASGSGIVFTPERSWSEWYYIRVNQLRAPDIAGRYLFKIFLADHYPTKHQSSPLINSTMPVENWPTLLVKGEVDPAVIYGTVRYGESAHPTLHGDPIGFPGVVRAVGIATHPYTGEATNRHVEARGYFNASAKGHFEVEGVAPGIYDLYASAAGLPERLVAHDIRLLRGQSLSIDLYLEPGPEIRGEVFSKSCLGQVPWKGEFPISIVIYDSDNYIEANVASYSPINLTHAPYTSYVTGNTVFDSIRLAPPNKPKLAAFPWEGPVSYCPYTAAPPFRDPFGVHNGVGPAQVWWVSPEGAFDPVTGLGSSPTSFRFQFGAQRYYGAPRLLSGMVPQTLATWIDGLGPGTYFIRAHVSSYVQTDISGSSFRDYYFTVNPDQTLSVELLIDLWLSGTLNLTVHFHDGPAGMEAQPIRGPDPARFLIAEALDSNGVLAAFNFTLVPASSGSATLTLNGLGMAGVIPPPDPRARVKYSLFRYRGVRDYGMYPGTYFLNLYMRGYIQAVPPAEEPHRLDQPAAFTISMCNSTTYISTHMFRGAGINVTVYSTDWQDPHTPRPWRWNSTPVSLLVYDVASRSLVDAVSFWDGASNTWRTPQANSEYDRIPWPDWETSFGSSSSRLITNGSTILERFGPDLPSPTSLSPDQDVASNAFLQSTLHLGFLSNTYYYRFGERSTVAIYPGQYSITGWTYGYVQEGVTALGDLGNQLVAAGMGEVADTSIRLIQGVEFDLKIVFRKELLPAGLPSNMSMRIRVYDDRDVLVAAASTSLDISSVQPLADAGFFADGKKIADAGCADSPIPAGTLLVEYKRLAGLLGYVDPTEGAESLRRLTQFSPDIGVWGGSPNPIPGIYRGYWQVLVELVPWYRPSEYYPPPQGMLQGETHQTMLTILLPYNHPGPYESTEAVVLPNVNLGGRASATVTLDLRGLLTGTVTFGNMRGDIRSSSWAVVFMNGTDTYTTYSWDGFYETYLPQGIYTVTVEEAGLTTQSVSATIAAGGVSTLNFHLRPTGEAVPEYADCRVLVTLAAGVTAGLLSSKLNRRSRRPPMIQSDDVDSAPCMR